MIYQVLYIVVSGQQTCVVYVLPRLTGVHSFTTPLHRLTSFSTKIVTLLRDNDKIYSEKY